MLVAVIPAEPSKGLTEALLVAGVTWRPARDSNDEWNEAGVLLVELGNDPQGRLASARRIYERSGLPTIAVTDRSAAAELETAGFLMDFVFDPPDPVELRLRLRRLADGADETEVLRFKELEMNTATYQARLDGVPLDMAYMEYELLRFFVQHPGRVWSREQLLSRVWGYDYFGGARTVDVHVRRLRAKLGEQRARWISTVRSVGYRFG
ncbi:phosphate regulon transcriptional regulatory protein PhoB [bacterium BMS3Abin02]|nr:phosphate regulon transcriptional regulatory protein PhoB [bacterium BMS3Abin02]GBE23038.1 phosphate regulon transcriptional regulatory protein PhoB [bacterium BMS3Bbin01]HDH25893.1 response regulator transcription factor [Actinomycetota bacterium]HDK44739.1 response regulator transcription factor [Actinomycetota bacterium]HDL48551.1 response regulator transcription factor [Actinomycetota bacterium]